MNHKAEYLYYLRRVGWVNLAERIECDNAYWLDWQSGHIFRLWRLIRPFMSAQYAIEKFIYKRLFE